MALVTTDLLKNLESGIRTNFFGTYEKYPFEYQKVATVIPSGKESENYGWLGAGPHTREWVKGTERQGRDIKSYEYTLKNKKWESTLRVERTAIEDDQTGQVLLRAKGEGNAAAEDKERRVWEQLPLGLTANGYDGTTFFSATHNESGANQSNSLNLALETTGANLQTAITAFQNFTDDTGTKFKNLPDTIIVPSAAIEWIARRLLNSAYYPNTAVGSFADNVLKGIVNLVVCPWLTDTTRWYLAKTNGIIKPLILQQRTDLEFNAKQDANSSDTVFERDEFSYGTRERYAVGFGDWKYILTSKP